MLLGLCAVALTAFGLPLDVLASPLNARQQITNRPTVTIDSGTVVGTSTAIPSIGAVNKYLGVPFARIPARFSPSVTITNFSGSFDASQYGPSCYQQFIPVIGQPFIKPLYNTPPPAPEAEDCLNINIYTPADAGPSSNLSVLFWLYGGSLQFGSNSIQIYDGSRMSLLENVVVVSVNYRTNVFGFPATTELPVAQRNLGLLDQRRALEWCQRNLKAFGGDPSKITLVGESAGSYSIDAIITSYNSSDILPFRAAIMQSGLYSNDQRRRLTGSTASWESLAASFNCSGRGFSSNLTCLRAANATAIQLTIEKLGLAFNPTIDNVTAVANPAQKRRNRNIANVPLLIGTNANEGRVFSLGQSNLSAYASTLFPSQPAQVAAVVAAYTTGTGYDQVSAATTDATFQCPTAALAADDAQAYRGKTYRYFYNATFPNLQVLVPLFGVDLGAFHASEIPQIYGTFPKYNTTTQQYALSRTMQSIWGSFIRNPQAGPGWPAYGTGSAGSVTVGTGTAVAGGQYTNGNGTVLTGNYSIAVLGNRGNTLGSGVTIAQGWQVLEGPLSMAIGSNKVLD